MSIVFAEEKSMQEVSFPDVGRPDEANFNFGGQLHRK